MDKIHINRENNILWLLEVIYPKRGDVCVLRRARSVAVRLLGNLGEVEGHLLVKVVDVVLQAGERDGVAVVQVLHGLQLLQLHRIGSKSGEIVRIYDDVCE